MTLLPAKDRERMERNIYRWWSEDVHYWHNFIITTSHSLWKKGHHYCILLPTKNECFLIQIDETKDGKWQLLLSIPPDMWTKAKSMYLFFSLTYLLQISYYITVAEKVLTHTLLIQLSVCLHKSSSKCQDFTQKTKMRRILTYNLLPGKE
jgi:hypothetical protein